MHAPVKTMLKLVKWSGNAGVVAGGGLERGVAHGQWSMPLHGCLAAFPQGSAMERSPRLMW
jgi:hypothetical protein